MITEQPKPLFYTYDEHDEDVREATRIGFFSGVIASGIMWLLGIAGFIYVIH